MSDGATPLYVAVDIGCIECDEPSAVLGVFTSEDRADEVCAEAAERQGRAWHGSHHFEVFAVPAIDVAGRMDYGSFSTLWGAEHPEVAWG